MILHLHFELPIRGFAIATGLEASDSHLPGVQSLHLMALPSLATRHRHTLCRNLCNLRSAEPRCRISTAMFRIFDSFSAQVIEHTFRSRQNWHALGARLGREGLPASLIPWIGGSLSCFYIRKDKGECECSESPRGSAGR